MIQPATILAVDDTESILQLLVRILTRAGYEVHAESNGKQALAYVAESPPDLILLDVRMDGMSGLDVCQTLKSNPKTQAIPIILVSGFADVEDWVDGLKRGAADYITKPFQPVELLNRVKTHLTLRLATQALNQHALLLGQTNERLQTEIQERLHVEAELRQSLKEATRAHRAMLSALEDSQRSTSALRQSEEKYRLLFEASSDAMMTLEPPEWRFASANTAALKLFRAPSVDTFLGSSPVELSPERQQNGQLSVDAAKTRIEQALRDGSSSFEWTHQRLDGTDFPATVRLTRICWNGTQSVQATVRDISTNKHLEAELAHNHKLEAVGQLAAGIAHEINTPAQFVGDGLHFLKEAFEGYQRLLMQYRTALETVSDASEHASLLSAIAQIEAEVDLTYLNENVPSSFERCIDGVGRVATIVRAMKEFAHPDEREMAAADINQALRNALTIAKNEYKYVADVETKLGVLPPVLCHIGDLSQVFLNLIVNAAHAISDVVGKSGERGVIRVVTQPDGAWVQIDIGDSGGGMPPSIRQRVFDPFFTTKEVGRGTGQGLAISRSIVVVKHHGTLTFHTELGEGTTFTIKLPIGGQGQTSTGAPQ